MDNRDIGLTIIDGPTATGMSSSLARSLTLHSQKLNLNPFLQTSHGPIGKEKHLVHPHQFGIGPSSDLLSALLNRL